MSQQPDTKIEAPTANVNVFANTTIQLSKQAAEPHKYSYTKFNPENLRFQVPRAVDFPKDADVEGKYCILNILYEYGTPQASSVEEFSLEGPKAIAKKGVTSGVNKKGKLLGYNYNIELNLNNPEHVAFNKCFHQIYVKMVEALGNYDGEILKIVSSFQIDATNLDKITPDVPRNPAKYPVYYPREGRTIIPGRSPFLTSKVQTGDRRTKFVTVSHDKKINEITVATVTSFGIEGVPMYNIPRITITATGATLKVIADSVVVTDLHDLGNTVKQVDTINKMMEDDSFNKTAIQDQIRLMLESQSESKTDSEQNSGSSNTGIVPTGESDSPIQPIQQQIQQRQPVINQHMLQQQHTPQVDRLRDDKSQQSKDFQQGGGYPASGYSAYTQGQQPQMQYQQFPGQPGGFQGNHQPTFDNTSPITIN